MEISQKSKKDKIVSLFGRVDTTSSDNVIKKIWEINCDDEKFVKDATHWAEDNGATGASFPLSPITVMLSTFGGSCYDGLSIYDAIRTSNTPVEIYCFGKIMSMGIIVLLSSKTRKAYRNTTFMIHQVSGISFGTLTDMKQSVEETQRINDILFRIITENTNVPREKLEEVIVEKKDWFITAEEALELGIITEIID